MKENRKKENGNESGIRREVRRRKSVQREAETFAFIGHKFWTYVLISPGGL
jgi:hypothetical protein